MSRDEPDDTSHDDMGDLAASDADEEVDSPDVGMDSDGESVMSLHNDSIAHFDLAPHSLFAIAAHPRRRELVAVGGSGGEADDAPGVGFIIDTSVSASTSSTTRHTTITPDTTMTPDTTISPSTTSASPRASLPALARLDAHSDSINALAWTLPTGDALLSGGLDGRLQVWNPHGVCIASAHEVDEINWLAPCPSPAHPNVFALGGADGSVWIYQLHLPSDLTIMHSFFSHTAPCTAGVWTPDGALLITTAQDSSTHVWDIWPSPTSNPSSTPILSLPPHDARFACPDGIFALATDPRATILATGAADGSIKLISLPRPPSPGGALLATLHAQSDSIESLVFSPSGLLLAAASVDGSIAVFDTGRNFALRHCFRDAHAAAVVRIEFGPGDWSLTSCGMDGVVRRWDLRAGSSDAALVREWKGHASLEHGGGVMGFVQGDGRIVTVGDDGIALVFEE